MKKLKIYARKKTTQMMDAVPSLPVRNIFSPLLLIVRVIWSRLLALDYVHDIL